MGLDSDIIVIGPYAVLVAANALDYSETYYKHCTDDTIIITTLAVADTTRQSELLAELCNVDPYDISQHQITEVQWPWGSEEELTFIGDLQLGWIFDALRALLEEDECLIFFRPNA